MAKFEREMLHELINGDDARSAAELMEQYRFIGELAKQYGVSSRTIRFYEDKGFLAPRRRGRYRLYGPRDEQRLKFILLCRRMGLSINKIATTLDLLACCNESEAIESLIGVYKNHLLELQDRQDLLRKEESAAKGALQTMRKLTKAKAG